MKVYKMWYGKMFDEQDRLVIQYFLTEFNYYYVLHSRVVTN
jgi:hypothetical protein